jgi:hypothetical protein
MRLFVLILVLAVTNPAIATVWEASPDLSPQATHSSLEVTIAAADGFTDVNGSGIVFRGGWVSDQACIGCVFDGVLTADAASVGLPNPGVDIQSITMAVTLPTLDITLVLPGSGSPTIAQVNIDHFLGVWTNLEGSIPADSVSYDREGQWAFSASGSVLLQGELFAFDYDYISPEVAVAQNLLLGSDSFQMSGMLFGGSSGPAEVLLGTIDGVDYTLALTPGFGAEQFLENVDATIVPEPSTALFLGMGLLGLAGGRR